MKIRRTISFLAAAIGVSVLAAGLGFAANMSVNAEKLTSVSEATSVPISTCSLNAASADTYADQATGNSNFGTGTTVLVQSRSGSRNRRMFIQFNLGSCSIASSAEIKTASLKTYMSTAPTANRTYGAYRISASWGETTLTWNNQPATAGVTSTTTTGTTSGVTLTWNVQADVAAFVAGTATNYGWMVRDQTESSSTARSSTHRSAEWGTVAQRPVLDITYYP